jgi:hypothetical protein
MGVLTAGGEGARFICTGKVVSPPQKYVGGHEEGEDYRDDAVRGKEGGVEFA